MADVRITHSTLESAIADLQREAGLVLQHMENLSGGLVPLRDTFEGTGRREFDDFERTVSQSQGLMQSNLNDAVRALNTMHETHRRADARGGQVIQGG